MKYPQSESVAMPRQVEDWLEGELESRGINSVMYSPYILSLMQQSSSYLESDTYDHQYQSKLAWPGQSRIDLKHWNAWDQDHMKRQVALGCLKSTSGQKYEIESLVDTLCAKLKEFHHHSAMDGFSRAPGAYTEYSSPSIPSLDGNMSSETSVNSTTYSSPAWTRELLRASPLPFYPYPFETPSENRLSMTLCTTPARLPEDAKPLYERCVDRESLKIFDKSIQEIWNPLPSVKNNHLTNQQNEIFYQNTSNEVDFGKIIPWSLGDVEPAMPQPQLPSELVLETSQITGKVGQIFDENQELGEDGDLADGENVLVSALVISPHTHFRPIVCDDTASQTDVEYEDGTTFFVCPKLDDVPFQRSESGTLFLETSGKYMLYKEDQVIGVEKFVPKFRVHQSNEKCCQTDDIEFVSAFVDYRPSRSSFSLSVSSEDTSDLLGEEEIAEVAAPGLSDFTSTPDGESSWEMEQSAIVDTLLDQDGPWKECESRPESSPQWAFEVESWGDKQPCETCNQDTQDISTNQCSANTAWQEIWGRKECSNCKINRQDDQVQHGLRNEYSSQPQDNELFEDFPYVGERVSAFTSAVSSERIHRKASGWNLGPLSYYLEKRRARVFEMFNQWRGDNEIGKEREILVNKSTGHDLRELWSPTVPNVKTSETQSLMREEVSEDGDQLLSHLSLVHLHQQQLGSSDTDVSEALEDDSLPSLPHSPVIKLTVTAWKLNENERPYNSEIAQKERKRRHSSSQRMCELYVEGECKRPHCRFVHGDEDWSVFRDHQRAFTM